MPHGLQSPKHSIRLGFPERIRKDGNEETHDDQKGHEAHADNGEEDQGKMSQMAAAEHVLAEADEPMNCQ